MAEKGERIGVGRTAEVFAWGSDRIVKLYQQGFPRPPIEHEFVFTRAAESAGVPVAAADSLVECDGRYGIIFERLDGYSMLDMLSRQPLRLVEAARMLADLHARVHACSLPADAFPPQRAQVERAICGVTDLPEEAKRAALARLSTLPDGHSLCHNDFHPANVLITSRGPVIIDWMTASRGSPLADICRTALIFQTSGLPPGMPLTTRLMFAVFRRAIEQVYISRYLQIRPGSRKEIHPWLLPLLTARLREVEDYPEEKRRILDRIQTLLREPSPA